MLCIQDHMDVHIDTQLRRTIEWGAIERFIVATGWQVRFWEPGDWTPIEIIRTMITQLEKDGRTPDDFSAIRSI